jgi:hypothetical protein
VPREATGQDSAGKRKRPAAAKKQLIIPAESDENLRSEEARYGSNSREMTEARRAWSRAGITRRVPDLAGRGGLGNEIAALYASEPPIASSRASR